MGRNDRSSAIVKHEKKRNKNRPRKSKGVLVCEGTREEYCGQILKRKRLGKYWGRPPAICPRCKCATDGNTRQL
jgi:hypothetical protein